MNAGFARRLLRRLADRTRAGQASKFLHALEILKHSQPLFALPALVEKPEGARVLVIAPHQDDETLGCGGTLRKHHLAGDAITVVFMTDGSRGDSESRGVTGATLISLRQQEARDAAAVIGIGECLFLGNQDTQLQYSDETVGQLDAIVQSREPDVVYAPSPFETHRDHMEACLIAAAALARYPRPVQVYLYEIWAPVPANCAVQIDLERKVAAARAYRSQMDERELPVALASSLARYRGISSRPVEPMPAECFLRLDRSAFVQFVRTARGQPQSVNS